jgi:pyruvate ferredoxin oxidoreductase gamma subunit
MYRIRFHGRGGQGIKTAGRVLGTAFFLEGFEVQDAPRYGAERRGAPIFAYVRASKEKINERGIISKPDLIVTADESLITIPSAGVLLGAMEHTVLLIKDGEDANIWKERINFPGAVITVSVADKKEEKLRVPPLGAVCVGAAARLIGVISREELVQAIREELILTGETAMEKNIKFALTAYDLMSDHAGCVREGESISAESYESPEWVDMPFEDARISSPAIYAAATSVEVKTGLWRTMRPVIDYTQCRKCWWLCSTFCPDSSISLNDEGYPRIDYEHCKGCLICAVRCLRHAIGVIPEKAVTGGKDI